jgi:hypothetical protein
VSRLLSAAQHTANDVVNIALDSLEVAQQEGLQLLANRPPTPCVDVGELIAEEIGLSDSAPVAAFGAVVRSAIDSMSGVFGTTRRTVFALAIPQLCAGNPASPQSVPTSVLLNFFMTASGSRWSFHTRHGRCR